jgi:DNA invertase Pin-like site-specific DNA recombinase
MSIKYFIYARKSSEGEDRQMASIEDQVSEMTRIAKELQLNVVEVITESKSAKAPGRVAFNDMLIRIQKGEASGILCWKLNRLARNPIDGGQISWLLQNGIIQRIQCYGREYRPEDNVLMMSVELGMANQYIKDLSVDVKRGMRKKAERGWYPGCIAPTGYMHNPKKELNSGEDEIIPDTVRLPLVNKLLHRMHQGRSSVKEIWRYADSIGLRSKKGKPYSYHAIYNLLTNEFYAGYFLWPDETGQSVRHRGKHKAIISIDVFNRIQEIIESQSVKTRVRTYDYPYKAILQCGKCHGAVTAQRKIQIICSKCKTKFSSVRANRCPECRMPIEDMTNPSKIDRTYYHCIDKNGLCSKASVTLRQLDDYLLEEFNKLKMPRGLIEWIRKELMVQNQEMEYETAKQVKTLKKRHTECQNRLNRYAQMRADSELDKDEYAKLKEEVTNDIRSIEGSISEIEVNTSDWSHRLLDWIEKASTASQRLKKADPKGKNQVVGEIGSNLNIKDRKPYFTTPNALSTLQECVVIYKAKIQGLEPKKSLVLQRENTHFEVGVSQLRAKLRAIRTYQIGKSPKSPSDK